MFITFAQIGQAFTQAVLLRSVSEQRSSFQSFKMCVGVSAMITWRCPGEGSEG